MIKLIIESRSKFCLIILVGLVSCPVLSHEDKVAMEKMQRMQTAIDEITLRLAGVLEENRRLSDSLKEVLESSHRGQRVVVGCDTKRLRANMATPTSGSGKANELHDFLLKNGKKCTNEQLRLILNNRMKWADDTNPPWFYTDKSVPLIELYLEK